MQQKALIPGTYLVYAYSDAYKKLSNPVTFYVKGNSTKINTKETEEDVYIYPNPFSKETMLYSKEPLINATINIYNSIGQQVRVMKNVSGQSITMSRENLPAGMYLIQIFEGQKYFKQMKVIVVD